MDCVWALQALLHDRQVSTCRLNVTCSSDGADRSSCTTLICTIVALQQQAGCDGSGNVSMCSLIMLPYWLMFASVGSLKLLQACCWTFQASQSSCQRIVLCMHRRSGNMATAPSSQSPFEQAATFLRHRKEARPMKREGTMALRHDQDLAASISRAWIALPGELRHAGWPSWCEHAELVTV